MSGQLAPKFQQENSAKLSALAAQRGKQDKVDLCRILSADLHQGPFAFADKSNAFLEKDKRVLMRQLLKGKRLVNGEEIA